MLKMGTFGLLNGVGMLLWPSRMPDWLPPYIVALLGMTASVGIVVASFAKVVYSDMSASEFVEPPPSNLVVLGRVCLAVLAVLYTAMSLSLFIGWEPAGSGEAVGAVTQSLDRVLLYTLASGMAFDMLREPVNNPVSARHRLDQIG